MSREAVSTTGSAARPANYRGIGIATLQRLWCLWRQQMRDRRQLAHFTDRELRDLGITHSDVHRELARAFWQQPFP